MPRRFGEVRQNSRDDEVKLTKQEKLEAIASRILDYEASVQRGGYGTSGYARIDFMASRMPMTVQQIAALLRSPSNVEEIERLAGVRDLEYHRGVYYASGRGAFGRLGGGRRGIHNEPTLTWKPGRDPEDEYEPNAALIVRKLSPAELSWGDFGRPYQSSATYGVFLGDDVIAVINKIKGGGFREPVVWEASQPESPWRSVMRDYMVPHGSGFRAFKQWIEAHPDEFLERVERASTRR